MAVTKLSSVTRSSYSNEVGGYTIEYNIARNEGEKAMQITGNVRSNTSKRSDPVACNIYAGVNGDLNVNFNPGISADDKTLIFSACLTDVDSIFNELNQE